MNTLPLSPDPQREQLLVGVADIRCENGGMRSVRAIRLAAVPGLAATECHIVPGSWTVTHEKSGCRINPAGQPDLCGPWVAAVRLLWALAPLADWTLAVADVVRGEAVHQGVLLAFTQAGWCPESAIPPRRVVFVLPREAGR